MDSFFSAVEVRENPELKGLPVIVGGHKAGEEKAVEEPGKRIRGVVSTCSYEAREYGVHSAMALSQSIQTMSRCEVPTGKYAVIQTCVERTNGYFEGIRR